MVTMPFEVMILIPVFTLLVGFIFGAILGKYNML